MMDQEIKVHFAKEFDFLVAGFDVTALNTPMHMLGQYNVQEYTVIWCDIRITGCFITEPPPEYTSLEWFDMRDCGHALHVVKTSGSLGHANMIELRYRTDNTEKFLADLKDVRFRRFSRQFHKQLEDILD